MVGVANGVTVDADVPALLLATLQADAGATAWLSAQHPTPSAADGQLCALDEACRRAVAALPCDVVPDLECRQPKVAEVPACAATTRSG